jgi:hypothetical protein
MMMVGENMDFVIIIALGYFLGRLSWSILSGILKGIVGWCSERKFWGKKLEGKK